MTELNAKTRDCLRADLIDFRLLANGKPGLIRRAIRRHGRILSEAASQNLRLLGSGNPAALRFRDPRPWMG
jgi:hypothetical protein